MCLYRTGRPRRIYSPLSTACVYLETGVAVTSARHTSRQTPTHPTRKHCVCLWLLGSTAWRAKVRGNPSKGRGRRRQSLPRPAQTTQPVKEWISYDIFVLSLNIARHGCLAVWASTLLTELVRVVAPVDGRLPMAVYGASHLAWYGWLALSLTLLLL